jgi:hypothetical protein
VSVQGEHAGHGRWELTSETGSVRVGLPPDARPVLARAEAGGEVTCEFEAGDADQGLELLLSAAGDIEVAASEVERHRRRSCGARSRRHGMGPILPDVHRMVSDAIGPIFGRRSKPPDLREERLMVLRMLESGKVNAEEAARLLDSLGG